MIRPLFCLALLIAHPAHAQITTGAAPGTLAGLESAMKADRVTVTLADGRRLEMGSPTLFGRLLCWNRCVRVADIAAYDLETFSTPGRGPIGLAAGAAGLVMAAPLKGALALQPQTWGGPRLDPKAMSEGCRDWSWEARFKASQTCLYDAARAYHAQGDRARSLEVEFLYSLRDQFAVALCRGQRPDYNPPHIQPDHTRLASPRRGDDAWVPLLRDLAMRDETYEFEILRAPATAAVCDADTPENRAAARKILVERAIPAI